uniref:Selenoprotein P2 n=1 Tax=Tetraodon nigroviridis TaxID=99883 RepID=H3DJR4_TETNG
MEALVGRVVVVALLKASTPPCDAPFPRIGPLREKLSRRNVTEVSFVIVNEQEPVSRALYWQLRRRAPPGVPVYQQAPLQDDVWEALDGDKDDFLIYDRCGQLTFHIGLPYSSLRYTYVEAAVIATYQGNICNCSANCHISEHQQQQRKWRDAQSDQPDGHCGDRWSTHYPPPPSPSPPATHTHTDARPSHTHTSLDLPPPPPTSRLGCWFCRMSLTVGCLTVGCLNVG